MAIFRKTKLDPDRGREDVRQAHESLRDGFWRPAAELLEVPGDRSLLVSALCRDDIDTSTYERWAKDANNATSWTLYGRKLTQDAWLARTSTRAEHVAPDAWPKFFALLEQATDAVNRAHRVGPPSADAHAQDVVLARGQQLGVGAVRTSFQQAHELVSFHQNATAQALQGLCDKWGGSHDEMFAFARWVSANAEPDAACQDAVPVAHFERWLSVADGGVTRSYYFEQLEVRSEIVAVAERMVEATAPGPARAELLPALNHLLFAIAHGSSRKHVVVKELLTRIDRRPTEHPWIYTNFANPAAGFDRAVKQLPKR